MAIDQIGVAAAIPQQYEEVITSSGNWSVPVGVKTVEYIVAGGGGSSYVRGGVDTGLYNVDGKSSIPIIVGAEAASNSVPGGTTVFDSTIVCTGGIYTSSTSHYTGNVVNLSKDTAGVVNNATPIQGATEYQFASGTGTVGYFAAFNGKGIAISTNGSEAMYSIDMGITWGQVASITDESGNPTTLANVLTTNNLRMDHNAGNTWVMRREGSSYLAYTLDNGVNWVVLNVGFTFYDALIAGDSNSSAVILSTTGGVQRTSNVATNTWNIASGNRVDMFFRTNANGQNITGVEGSNGNYWEYSTNGGSTWTTSTSSISQGRGNNTNRYSKSSSSYRTTAVVEQRGLNSDYLTFTSQESSNNRVKYVTYYSVNQNNSTSTTSPQGTQGSNNESISSMYIWKPQTFHSGYYGISIAWFETSNTVLQQYNMSNNFTYINLGDGGMTPASMTSPSLGGAQYHETSRYLVVPIEGGSSSDKVLYAYSGIADGRIYRTSGYDGRGRDNGHIYSTQRRIASDAAGTSMTWNSNSTYPYAITIGSPGFDGWGRNETTMSGYGYGGPGQDGGVRLRWWA
jgi:hypothetical protein